MKTFYDRQTNNRRHESRPERNLIFNRPHDKKGLPTLNFLSGFLRKAKTPAKKFSTALASWIVTCIVTAFLTVDCFAQIQQPQTPQFGGFTPMTPGQSYTPQKNYNNNPSQNRNPYGSALQPPKADQMIKYGETYTTPEAQQKRNEEYIKNKMANDPAYQMPNKENNFTQFALKREKEMMNFLNEISSINYKVNKSGYYNSEKFKTDFPNYQNAFNNLKNMLEGKIPLSLADALYMEEAAYGNLHMTYDEYKKEIKRCAGFIKQWMLENGYNPKNPEHVHMAIQKFMGDTLHLKNNNIDNIGGLSLPKGHNPYSYDYIDYKAEEDLRNYFLTKTLATGTGQCHTLPNVYSVLAEALGVEASISFVHQHSFIKYKNTDGTIQNYEPTIDWHMTDNDYTEDLPVMSAAIASKIYLQPLTKKQMVASVMIDLAYNFHREHWIADGKFMNQCIDYGMKYFHNGEGHREGLLLKNLVLASQLDRVLLKNNITDLNDIEKSPEATQAYIEFRKNSDKIKALGIQHYPDDVYNAMLEKHDSRGKLQTAKGIDTKSKKSLFFNLQTK